MLETNPLRCHPAVKTCLDQGIPAPCWLREKPRWPGFTPPTGHKVVQRHGGDGVRKALSLIEQELKVSMSLTGVRDVKDVSRDILFDKI